MAHVGNQLTCKLEFDGASRGNPGRAGAGAILRAEGEDGRKKVYRLRKGLGYTTNIVAEYKALILGLTYAITNGYKHIHVEGDSELVVSQVEGRLEIDDSQNLVPLYNEAIQLKNLFHSFSIELVPRQYNTEADRQANLGINLEDGEAEVYFR